MNKFDLGTAKLSVDQSNKTNFLLRFFLRSKICVQSITVIDRCIIGQ